ncbi:MAG: hypothetical protein Pars2KO_04410 [Parasphingorhabdus sp.]
MNYRFTNLFLLLLITISAQNPAFGQNTTDVDPLQYADLADLSVDAPIIVHATVKRAVKIKGERALSAPPGTQRYYVEAETNALIRGSQGIAETIRYVVDLPLDGRGRAPKIKRKPFIIFARSNQAGNGQLQLIARDAQIAWTPTRDTRVKAIVREIVSRNAAPAISRIGSSFHVPGTILGEGETQIFMETDNNVPISISVLSRDGQQKAWAVSLGEIVDEAARAPVRNTLLWYRLACFLPDDLPFDSLDGQSAENAAQARRDYRMVLRDLGSCPRSRLM